MKTIKIMTFLFCTFFFIKCVKDNDFEVPEVNSEENESLTEMLTAIAEGEIELKTISQIKGLYVSGEEPLQIASDIAVKGYVVSSDREGNFYKEIFLQDAPNNPTSGIKVILNMTNSYNKYNFGREVYVYLKGLYIGEVNSGDGIFTIGGNIKADNHLEIDVITSNQIEDYIFRSEITTVITPKLVPVNGINKTDIGTFITLDNCAFETALEGANYVDLTEDFDTQRTLVTCQGLGYFEMPLETSSFALFAHESLPKGGGTVNALVTKDYAGDVFVLALNSTDDIFLEDTRCEPIDTTGFSILLEEDFEETSGDIEIENWTNYKEAGTRFWKSYEDEFSLSNAANIGSFFSRNESTIAWLITPEINLEATNQEFLSFETSNSFADRSELEILISTNWNGVEETIITSNWQSLPAKIIDDGANNENWVDSGHIDLSEYKGTAYIAFKYTGSGDENYDGTYELDNIKIQGK